MSIESHVSVAVSTVADGTMKKHGADPIVVDKHRRRFLEQHNSSPVRSVLLQLDYNSDDFLRYQTVDDRHAGDGVTQPASIVADGLATQAKNLTLFLPLADCIGAVLYDKRQNVLMLSHLGRHNLEQRGGEASVEYLRRTFSTYPEDLEVWFSPHAGGESYPLYSFDNRSLQDVATEQLLLSGVKESAITKASIDTTKDERYFSHSEALKQRRPAGRFAVIATLIH